MRENICNREDKNNTPSDLQYQGHELKAVALDISNLVRLIFISTENINSAEDEKCILKFLFWPTKIITTAKYERLF